MQEIQSIGKPYVEQGSVKKLLEGVDFINQDPKARQGLLYHHGKIIAEVNGWTYNDELSKLNSNSGQLRYIFDSSLSL